MIQARNEGSRLDGERYHADAGVPMARAATETQQAGLTGLEFGLAIPGTVGGAVWANAGAHGTEIADVLESATLLLADGTEVTLPAAELGFSYRHSRLKDANRAGGLAGGDRPGRRVPPPARRRDGDQGARSTTSAAGAASTSRWGSRRRAPCSGTRRGTPRVG